MLGLLAGTVVPPPGNAILRRIPCADSEPHHPNRVISPQLLRGLSADQGTSLTVRGQHQLSTLSGTDGNQPAITGKRPTTRNPSSPALSRSVPAPWPAVITARQAL